MLDILRKIFPWALILPVLLPLVYYGEFVYPYVTPKTLLLRSLGMVSLAIFLVLVAYKTPFYWTRLKNKMSWLPAMLLVVSYITSVFGANFYHGFWSTFERGDGLFSLTIIVIYFYLFLLYSNRKFIELFLKTIMWVGGFVALYAVFQWLEMVLKIQIFGIEVSRGRIGSTFNNAAFMATYLSMTAVVSIFTSRLFSNVKYKYISYASFLVQLFAIFLSATRGAILAVIASLFFCAIYFAIKSTGKIKKTSVAAISIIILLGLTFPFYKGYLANSNIETFQRIGSMSLTEGTVGTRLYIWKELSKKAIEKPILGYGAENIDIPFNEIYNPEFIKESWFDRSHNSFLDYQIQFGVLGLVLYVSIILSLIYLSRKLYKNGEELLGFTIFLFTIMYSVNNFFVFDTAMSLWLLLVIFAVAMVFSNKKTELPLNINKPLGYSLSIFSALLVIMLIPAIITPARANMLYMDAYNYQVSQPQKYIDLVSRGYDLNTYTNLEYGYRTYVDYSETQHNLLSLEEKVDVYELVNRIATDNYNKYNVDIRSVLYYGHLQSLDPQKNNMDEVIRIMDEVIAKSPMRTHAWLIKANEHIKIANESNDFGIFVEQNKIAIEILSEYLEKVPSDSNIYFVIANMYYAMNNPQKASEWIMQGEEVYDGNIDAASQAVKYYITINNYTKAIAYAEDIIKVKTDDYDTAYDLAKLYYLTDRFEDSARIYKQLLEIAPKIVESDPQFINAIESYLNSN